MANVFNSVKGLHPKRNSFSAHTYRNDFTGKIGCNIPVYIQHVTAGTRVRCSASALIRLQALISPVMDNIDYYVHFWKVPYRLIDSDMFTKFITGENELDEVGVSYNYNYTFLTCEEFMNALLLSYMSNIEGASIDDAIPFLTSLWGDGSLLDMCGYDKKMFTYTAIEPIPGVDNRYRFKTSHKNRRYNFRNIVMYYMLHENWYMNENVPYLSGWNGSNVQFDRLVKGVSSFNLGFPGSLADLLVFTHYRYGLGGMLPHAWEKDYFTSALPNVQAGDPVSLPINGSAPVTVNTFNSTNIQISDPFLIYNADNLNGEGVNLSQDRTNPYYYHLGNDLHSVESQALSGEFGPRASGQPVAYGTADLSEATAITINELRFANALQKFKERQLRFGRRRLEYYKGFFDVEPEDLRLQVPKYLGGGRIPINIADIEQTSETSGSSALGHLAGKGTAVAGGFAGFETFCSEESILMGIAFAMPHITYARSVSRFLMKTSDRYDYFNPSFEHLGEQAIYNTEIYAGASDSDDAILGYTPRFNEYRFHANEMHGEFKNTLAYWTLGRIFNSSPALNDSFIYMQPSNFDRIFAVSGQPAMLCSMLFRQRIVQPVSKFGTPMLLA